MGIIIKRADLYYAQGTSDKEYHAYLEEHTNGTCDVWAEYGRRGATLQKVVKVSHTSKDQATEQWAELVRSKERKEYRQIASTLGVGTNVTLTTSPTTQKSSSGHYPQLLNMIDDHELPTLLGDSEWVAQQKFDGVRQLIECTGSVALAINRRGAYVSGSTAILTEAQRLPACLLDGEAIGDHYYAFDLLEFQGQSIRELPYLQRYQQLRKLLQGTFAALHIAYTAQTTHEKELLYQALWDAEREGIVFKQANAPSTPHRPASGGTARKYKFYATASVIVEAVNTKRSVAIAVRSGTTQQSIGNVTIPPNAVVPTVNTIIEVRYLYAYQNGSLYQPTYLGIRSDLSHDDCVLEQLKYKSAITPVALTQEHP
jgi:bifunctional non-homologous end joining protein LigD